MYYWSLKYDFIKWAICALSGENLLVHTTRNRFKIKLVEFTKFKLFRAILTKIVPKEQLSTNRAPLWLSKTDTCAGIQIVASSSVWAKQRKLTYINPTLMRSKVVTWPAETSQGSFSKQARERILGTRLRPPPLNDDVITKVAVSMDYQIF